MDIAAPDPDSAQPPFEQLRAQIASRVGAGDLAPGTRLPTVRSLALDLGLAANTVARAYRELENDGVIVTEGRRGSFVRSDVVAHRGGEAQAAAREYVAVARRTGLTCAEATRLVELGWPSGS
jgi:DNA-binding transcriptional regulator YhcF (GntR family)